MGTSTHDDCIHIIITISVVRCIMYVKSSPTVDCVSFRSLSFTVENWKWRSVCNFVVLWRVDHMKHITKHLTFAFKHVAQLHYWKHTYSQSPRTQSRTWTSVQIVHWIMVLRDLFRSVGTEARWHLRTRWWVWPGSELWPWGQSQYL